MTAYNLHEFWDSGRTGSATCIDADGSLVLGQMNLVDTRLNDSGEWAHTGVTVDTTNPADEMITNGTFDANVSGWAGDSGSISWSAGTLLLTEDGADSSASRAYQTITTVVGQTYRMSADVVSVSAGTALIAASTSPAYGGQPQTGGLAAGDTGVLQFTATSTTTYILLVASGTSARTVAFDNVSVLPLISSGTDSKGEKRYLLTEDTSTGFHSINRTVTCTEGETYTLSLVASASSGDRELTILFPAAVFGTNISYVVNLSSGELTQSLAGTNDSGSIENLGNGEYLVNITADATTSASGIVQFRLRSSGTGSYTGDGTSGVYLSQPTVYESSVGPRAELVVDGDFPDLSNWDLTGSAWTASGNKAVGVATGGVVERLEQTLSNLTVGNEYRLSFTVDGATNLLGFDLGVDVSTTTEIDDLSITANGTFVYTFTATSTSHTVSFRFSAISEAGDAANISNVSVLPVTPQMQKSSKDNSLFMENETGDAKYALRVDHTNSVSRTNHIRNSTMQGAAVGLLSAGGSLPTNWTVSKLTTSEVEVIALGQEDGLDYVDIRLNGTPTGSVVVTFEGNAASPATLPNDVWTHSFYVKRVGGDETNINNTENRITELSGSRTFLAKHEPAFTLTTDRQRIVNTSTLTNPSVAYTNSAIEIGNTGAIDITIRLYAPQLEKSSEATDFIPTTNAAVTVFDPIPEVLAEPAGTNLALYNVGPDINSTNWSEDGTTTVTPNAATVAGISASLVDIGSVGSSLGPNRISQAITVSGSTQYVAYTIVKQLDTEHISLRAFNSGGVAVDARVDFAFATETLLPTATDDEGFIALSDGSYLLWFSFTTDAGNTACNLRVGGHLSGGTTTADQFYVAAMQLSAGHALTSPIPTSGAAATRVKDEPTRATPEGFIQGEGSIYFEGSIDYETGGSGFPRVFQIDDGTGNNRVGLIPTESTNSMRVSVADGGVGLGVGDRVVNSGEVFKSSVRYADDDLAISTNGQSVQSVFSVSISAALTTVRIGDLEGVQRPIRIRDFRLFPYSSPAATPGWSNDTLQEISGA